MIDREAMSLSRFTHSEWAKFHLPWLITIWVDYVLFCLNNA